MKSLRKILVLIIVAFSPVALLAGMTPQDTKEAAAEIDALLAADWKQAGVVAGNAISDEIFVRRVCLDLAGRIPTAGEAIAFLESTNPERRAVLIADLLSRESYVSNFYNYWADILRIKSHFSNTANVVPAAYIRLVKESLRSNKPYDQFVRELLGAKGYAWGNGAIGYYMRDPEMPLDNMAITSRIFLGTRIECAQCHDHPFDKWKQTQFYHLAAYTIGNKPVNEAFSGARDAIRARQQSILDDFKKEKAASKDGGRAAEQRKNERLEAMEYRRTVGIIKGCVGQLFSPIGMERRADASLKLPHEFHMEDAKPGDVMDPRPIFGDAPSASSGQDKGETFARWVTSPQNPRFTRVIVNRLWKKMFGVAVIEPLDELRDDTKPMLPELEAYLEKLMIAQHYDMRAFLAVLANTRAYQSAVLGHEFARGDTHHFQAPILRRMTAEQIWDSLVALANDNPDARNLELERRDERRIAVSHMACDAYLNFDGERLVAMAMATLRAENDWEQRKRVVNEAMIAAKRSGDTEKERELHHREGDLNREHGEMLVRDFLMPILTHLVEKKLGPGAKPIVDQTYQMNTNPSVLTSETWRRMYVPGYGPAPKTAAQAKADAMQARERLVAMAAKFGFAGKDSDGFVKYCERADVEWVRASEMDSPAPRGHFLRTMGQSDRDFVENANPTASIPQALALMNSDLISDRGLLSRYSPMMRFINQSNNSQARIDAIFMCLLSRKPTTEERALWREAQNRGMTSDVSLIYALLNTKQFSFIQ